MLREIAYRKYAIVTATYRTSRVTPENCTLQTRPTVGSNHVSRDGSSDGLRGLRPKADGRFQPTDLFVLPLVANLESFVIGCGRKGLWKQRECAHNCVGF
jgi:hypothetical protein